MDELDGIINNRLPIWAFHGVLDPIVDIDSYEDRHGIEDAWTGQRKLVEELISRGMEPAPKYTWYPDVEHNSWDGAYSDPLLLDWVFSQSKSGSVTTALVYGRMKSHEALQGRRGQADVDSRIWRDLDYVGDGIVGHRLDIYLPKTGRGPFPVVVHIYGSAFFENDGKGRAAEFAPLLGEEGIAVAGINHRGTRTDKNATFPAQAHDVKAAVRFLRANAAAYNLDPDRIGATGESSGGHLVAFLGTSGGVMTRMVGDVTMDIEGSLGAHTGVSSRVQAVCDWFGPTDFLVMDSCGSDMEHDAPDSPESLLVGGPIQDHPNECALANPITYIDPDDPAFMIVHGDEDPLVPYCNSNMLAEALKKARVSCDYTLVEGAGHGEGIFEPEYLDKMVEFFKRHLAE